MASVRRRAKTRAADQNLSRWTKRRVLSWSLFTLAGIVAIQHLLAHGGFHPIPLSMGWQDLLIGYPTAAVLAIAGGIALDPNPHL